MGILHQGGITTLRSFGLQNEMIDVTYGYHMDTVPNLLRLMECIRYGMLSAVRLRETEFPLIAAGRS